MHHNSRKQVLPPINNLLLLESATSLAHKIRYQKVTSNFIIIISFGNLTLELRNTCFTIQVTSEELVNIFTARIKAVNPIINCVVADCFELALQEAQKIDKMIQSGVKDPATLETETPFLGVPFTTKESMSVKGIIDFMLVFYFWC